MHEIINMADATSFDQSNATSTFLQRRLLKAIISGQNLPIIIKMY